MVLATAAFLVWAVQFSDFGKGSTTIGVQTPAPPQASPIAVRLANAIGRASLGRRHRMVDMTKVAPFAWGRMYVFSNETSADIRRRLGFEWSGAPDTVPRHGQRESLLVFTAGQRVTGSAFFSEAIGRLDCLGSPSGYRRGTRFSVRFTSAKPPEAYLVNAPPGPGERACLNAVGVFTGR